MLLLVNRLAEYSCPKYNSFRPLRVICRYAYRGISELYVKFSPAHRRQHSQNHLSHTLVDTYPWPYSDLAFPLFPETDGALVTDPANFVIKHATSYCAWKIRELTGHWPTKPVIPRDAGHAAEITQRERPHDARYWQEFLAAQGYREIVPFPSSGYYIGVNPDYGEFGLVVWYETGIPNCDDKVIASSYVNHEYWYGPVSVKDFVWVNIV